MATNQNDAKEAQKNYITAEGKAKMIAELENLKNVKRPQVAQYIHEAKEAGDISESSAYEDAKNEQAMVEGRIQYLEYILANAVLLEPGQEDGKSNGAKVVRLGSTVEIESDQGTKRSYMIVSTYEADATANRISDQSPVGKALMGRGKGDKVEVTTPGGVVVYTVKTIK